MRTTTSRQKQLYLVAKLYELAAEFSIEELQVIRENLATSNEELAIRRAVDSLARLHEVIQENSPRQELVEEKSKAIEIEYPERSTWANVRYLEEIFNNKAIFPTLQDISNAVPGNLIPVHKESRTRYIKKVIRRISSLNDADKNKFMKRLNNILRSQPNSFISRWKSLIKDL